jgi:hypothetical protein
MNKSHLLTVLIVIALVLSSVLFVGCGKKEASSTGVVSDIAMSAAVADDARPLGPTDVFGADTQAIYCSFKVSNFPLGATMNAKLIYVGGEEQGVLGENYVLGQQLGTMERGEGGYTSIVWLRSSMINDVWPKGDYKVVLSVGGREEAIASFKVQ